MQYDLFLALFFFILTLVSRGIWHVFLQGQHFRMMWFLSNATISNVDHKSEHHSSLKNILGQTYWTQCKHPPVCSKLKQGNSLRLSAITIWNSFLPDCHVLSNMLMQAEHIYYSVDASYSHSLSLGMWHLLNLPVMAAVCLSSKIIFHFFSLYNSLFHIYMHEKVNVRLVGGF